ncbi:PACE efflux transporter [Ruegeria sp.]|uniref:PACE efflux transporter n=1 Tax=Ruegeria sp. TaxID=1879320 RepID=UPI00230CFD6C|nr:PACE efflux transporter [Ruegeria sp.]MDA7965434.1 PACE efflux transporter [Ruegeria sp.]
MRSFGDRLRHTFMFEGIALVIVSVAGSAITGHSMESIGILSVMFSILAMVWNFVFNLLFDLWDRKYRNMAPRGVGIRSLHAILFEAVMLIAGIFLTAWWLSIGYLEALILDLGFSTFFLIYAYVFNWAYDQVFPVPRLQEGAA